jgi:glycosyltransferase involved in cell wall biosynthesis
MVQAWEIGSLPQHLVPAHSVVWAGAATLEYGFELLLDALPVVAGECPTVVVDVTSYESSPERWQKEIARRGLERHFRFVGFIAEEDEFRRFVRRHRAGLATYHPSVSSQKLYAEVSRPLAYMAGGVPPIITRVPRQAAEIEQWGAGLVIDYRPESLAKAMVALLTDDELHQRCRTQGLEVAHRHDAEVICREVFAQLGLQTNLPTGEHS